MTPKHQAIAYLIWAECQQNGWDRTIVDVAKAVGVSYQMAAVVIGAKGWRERFRTSHQDDHRPKGNLTPYILNRDTLRHYGINV
jgi:hypothetical protein